MSDHRETPTDRDAQEARGIVQTFFVRDYELTTKPKATLKDKRCLADRIATALASARREGAEEGYKQGWQDFRDAI